MGVVPRTERIDSEFLYYFFLKHDLSEFANEAHLPSIKKTVVESWPIALPASLREQRRIVAILDEAFEAIATAKANANKNRQNAKAWVIGQMSAVLRAASEGAPSATLDALVAPTCTLSYGIVQPGNDVPEGLPVVRPVDLGEKTVRVDGLKRIDPDLARSYARTTLEGGDLLLCVRGTTGTVAVADSALAGANVTRGIVPIRFDPGALSQTFGYHLLRSESVQAQIRAKTYGAALMQINIGDLRKIVMTVPAMDEQPALVAKLDAIEDAGAQLVSLYTRKLAALDELKQSLLHQAFTGALTARTVDQQLAAAA
jgi:type I restriction enzyme S subunit